MAQKNILIQKVSIYIYYNNQKTKISYRILSIDLH